MHKSGDEMVKCYVYLPSSQKEIEGTVALICGMMTFTFYEKDLQKE